MAWRPSSSKAQAAAVIDYGRDFSVERSALPASLNPIVDEIEESLRQKPVDPTDHLQHGAEEGTDADPTPQWCLRRLSTTNSQSTSALPCVSVVLWNLPGERKSRDL